MGWDGSAYADWAQRDPTEILFGRTISEYYVGRMLTPIMVHYFSMILPIDISTTIGVIKAFYIFNSLCIALAIMMLWRIAKKSDWRQPVKLFAIACLFFNFAVLKNMSYNPTLTDMTGLLAAVLLLNAWLNKALFRFWLLAYLGGFIWPTLIYTTTALLFFWDVNAPIYAESKMHSRVLRYASSGVLAVGTTALALYTFYHTDIQIPTGTNPLNEHLFWMSVPLLFTFIFFSVFKFTDPEYFLRSLPYLKLKGILGAILLFIAIKGTISGFSSGEAGPLTPLRYLALIAQGGLINPLQSLVAHISHFGPVIAFALLLWFAIGDRVRAYGPGIVAVFAIHGYLAMGPESRQFLPFLPFLVFFLCEEMNHIKADWFSAWATALIALAMSRFWLQLNIAPLTGRFLEFPDQLFYMYSGPWMSDQMYLVFLALDLIVIVAAASMLHSIAIKNRFHKK